MEPLSQSPESPNPTLPTATGSRLSFRVAAFRGLGIIVPPLLTIVILLWIARTVIYYVLDPVASGVRGVVAWSLADVRDSLPGAIPTIDETIYQWEGNDFKKLPSGQFLPLEVYRAVSLSPGAETVPATAAGIYDRYVEIRYLKPWLLYPVLAALFLFVLYLVGKFLAEGVGRFLWSVVELVIRRVPVVRNVYSSVKQVTDFMVSDNQYEFNRVIAVEYPAKGLWTVAFVTGEGLADVQTAAGEPTLAVLIPTNPMPVTGYTAIVKRSEVIDLDLTIDQACEFIISCGVVVPPHQLQAIVEKGGNSDTIVA